MRGGRKWSREETEINEQGSLHALVSLQEKTDRLRDRKLKGGGLVNNQGGEASRTEKK